MHQVLIVDDHMHLVDSMEKTLPWMAMGVSSVHKAYSAFDAIDTLQSHSIDLVITDIRMPVMSGLELIQQIRTRWRNTRIILLSGYADFEYAKEALRQDVEDYLLKPVSNDELAASIGRVLEKAAAEWQAIISNQRAIQTLQEHLPLLRQNLLLELLRGRCRSEAVPLDKFPLYQLPFAQGDCAAIALIRLEDDFVRHSDHSVSLFEYAIANVAAEIFQDDFYLWYCRDDYGYLVFMITATDKLRGQSAETIKQLLEQHAVQLQHYVHVYLKGSISVLVSEWFVFPDEVASYYQKCLFVFRQRIGDEQDLFMTLAGSESEQKIASFSSLYEPPTLKQYIEAGQWQELYGKLERIFEELLCEWSQSEEHILEVYLEVCSMLTYIAHKNRKRLSELIGDEYEKVAGGLPFKTVKPLRDWTFRILGHLSDQVERERKHSHAAIVSQVNAFVEQNLQHDVSIQTVANHVFLHPSYLSRIYKSETGESYSDYVLKVRMERAISLLRNKGIKVYDISTELGYNQTQHFIKMFKKHFGLTPQEYRERML